MYRENVTKKTDYSVNIYLRNKSRHLRFLIRGFCCNYFVHLDKLSSSKIELFRLALFKIRWKVFRL